MENPKSHKVTAKSTHIISWKWKSFSKVTKSQAKVPYICWLFKVRYSKIQKVTKSRQKAHTLDPENETHRQKVTKSQAKATYICLVLKLRKLKIQKVTKSRQKAHTQYHESKILDKKSQSHGQKRPIYV